MEARAAVLNRIGGPLTIERLRIDDPGPFEVLIRTAAAGVCHSDLHYVDGSYAADLPVVPGHESAGVVEAVGSLVDYVAPGDHVITCLSAFCGHCKYCTSGRPNLCRSPIAARSAGEPPRLQRVADSGDADSRDTAAGPPASTAIGQLFDLSSFAERMLVHERAVAKIRPDMPLDRAALIGCAVTTGFGAVVNTADVGMGESVAVIGCGGVGLSAVIGAAAVGATPIIAVDINPGNLALAGRFGAHHLVDAGKVDPLEAVRELSGGGVEFSFEAIGRKATAELAFNVLRVGGCATVIGLVPENETIEIKASELIYEKTLQGSNMGSNQFRVDMPMLVDRYMNGLLPLDDMIARRIGLDDINDAFDELRSGTLARSVVVFDDPPPS